MYIQNMNAFRQLNGRHLRSIQIVGNSQQVCQENEIHQLQIVVVGIDRSLKYRLKAWQGQEGEAVFATEIPSILGISISIKIIS